MLSIPSMGKTMFKDIRIELTEMRHCWQTRMSRINVGLNKINVPQGNTWEETQPVHFHPKDSLECLFKGHMFSVEISSRKHLEWNKVHLRGRGLGVIACFKSVYFLKKEKNSENISCHHFAYGS